MEKHFSHLQDIRLWDEARVQLRTQSDSMDILAAVVEGPRKQILFPLIPVSVAELYWLQPGCFASAPYKCFLDVREQKWASAKSELACWCLMDVEIFPNSFSLDAEGQQRFVPGACPGYRVSNVWEYVAGGLLYQKATKNRVCVGPLVGPLTHAGPHVRFSQKSYVEGHWIGTHWVEDQLHIDTMSGYSSASTGSCAFWSFQP